MATKKSFISILVGIRRKKISFFVTIYFFQMYFSLIITIIITEVRNIYFSRITWLVATWSFFSLVVRLTLSVLHFFIADIGLKDSQLLPSFIILEIFSKHLTPREQRKLVLTRFNLENILSSLAIETGAVNNNLVSNSMSLQPLLLGAVNTLHHVIRNSSERKSFLCIIYLFRTIVPKIENRYFPPCLF